MEPALPVPHPGWYRFVMRSGKATRFSTSGGGLLWSVALSAQAPQEHLFRDGDSLVSPQPITACPRGDEREEVVVCGRRRDAMRYRVPPLREGFDPKGPVDSVSRERNRLMEGDSGGLGSCTTVGPNGMNGCFEKGVWRKRQQHAK